MKFISNLNNVNEINLRADEINEKINSIYFGGGTPSLISENDTKKILNAINKKFHISENAEVTLLTESTNSASVIPSRYPELKEM